jgi:glycolate oxidase FAD binding subunit
MAGATAISPGRPEGVSVQEFSPRNEAELARLLETCATRGVTLDIVGGGTRPVGNATGAKARLRTGRIRGITLYEPASLTMVVKAGTPYTEVRSALAAENQHLAFEPADWTQMLGTDGETTIGGIAAAGVSGPRRLQAGAARDALIGVHFVTGSGELAKSGGRVMKNVTGYDLTKLMCGSWGTLGVLTELSFKVAPKPEAAATVRVLRCDEKTGVALLARASTSHYDISGAAFIADARAKAALVRIEGFEASVAYRAQQLKDMLARHAPERAEIEIVTGEAANRAIWQRVRDVANFAGKPGSVWRLSVRPTRAVEIVTALRREYEVEALYDWAGGLVWILIREAGPLGVTVIRNLVDRAGGHATLMRAGGDFGSVPAFHPQPPALAALAAQLRSKFDPFGILNPGRMAPLASSRMAG